MNILSAMMNIIRADEATCIGRYSIQVNVKASRKEFQHV